ncbi:outer membrane protein assembly factor BamB family protein [Mariniblastus fucicola]|uniref:Outer membrane biogenesis protein BamB n=1 Tax=Mariniblastus fucicola TaxID=980251 RepID=A0A5B9PBU4_9BACT|nr:PQQ-binding-like beta-propeller repeat protein [Mariniblastus fucicola]QEG20633.1 outer membrane biogenesis protein BamB [Mariniblastus fucicola]
MTPKELLQKLESLGSIESKALRKIRIQVEDPERTVKTSAVLSYLVRKGQLTEEQARQIMQGETPSVSRRNTDELMVGVVEDDQPTKSAEVKRKPKPKRSNRTDRTREDVDAIVPVAAPIAEVEVDPLPGDEYVDEFNTYGSAEESGENKKPTFTGKIDKRDQWNSRWPYIGFGILGFLLMVGMFLWFTVSNMEPEAMYNNARDHYDNGSYQAAIKAYDEYIEAAPNHKFIKEAKARRVQSLLRDSYESKLWEETLIRAKEKLAEYAEDEDVDMDKIRDDLGVMLPRSLAELTTTMLKNTELAAMEGNLVKASGYKKDLVDNVFYVTSSSRKVPTNKKYIDKLENNIRTIEGYITKEKDYGSALSSIESLGEAGKTEEAFKTFQDLTRQYGDLAAREELRALMVKTSELESKLIQPAQVSISAVPDFAASAIEQTWVMGAIVGSPDEGLQGEVIPTLVDGSVLGFDAGTGEIAWRQFVGLGSSIQPQKMGEEHVLVSDVEHSDLLKLELATGQLVWRTPIGEKFFTPALTAEKLVITTASGKLLRLDPGSGELIGSAQLPQGANARCFISEQDPLIYQAGLKSNLYVIGTEDMECKEVFYLGHYSGSISVPPYMYNGHLIVLVNGGDYCDMFVLRPKENGMQLGPDPVQVIRRVANGPVTRHLRRYGRWLLAVSDDGQMVILEFNQGDEKTPISKFATESFESKEGQPSFIETDGSSLWVCGTGAAFYKVKRNLGKFDLKVLKHGTDSFVAPCLKLDDKLFHVRKRYGSGMVSASLVDANTLEQIWRNDFGGEVAGPVIDAGGKRFAVSNQGDLFEMPGDAQGNFIRQAAKASTVVESLQFSTTSDLGDGSWVSVGGAGSREFATIDATGSLKLTELAAPSDNPACEPITVDGQLIVANLNGQVAAIDPATGGMKGEAFLPPVAPGKDVKWIRPVQVSENQIAIATQVGEDSGATSSTLYLLNIEKGRSINSNGSLESTGNYVGSLASFGGAVFAADRVGDADAIVKTDSSAQEVARAALDGRVVSGPWAVSGGIMALLDSDQLVMLDDSLNQKWIRNVKNDRFACPPQEVSGQLVLVLQNGKVMFLDAASGDDVNVIDLGQPIVQAPTFADGKVFFSGMDGTVHVLNNGS